LPLTPLHYCTAYLLYKAKVGLVLPALIVSSVIPDIEFIINNVWRGWLAVPGSHRGLMHSLVGAVTVDTLLATLLTVLLYPPLVSRIFELEESVLREKCRLSSRLVLSAFIGSLLHVLIDATHHEYNPLLYPFVKESFDAIVLMGNWLLATVIVQLTFFVALLLILRREHAKGSGFWRRLLVG